MSLKKFEVCVMVPYVRTFSAESAQAAEYQARVWLSQQPTYRTVGRGDNPAYMAAKRDGIPKSLLKHLSLKPVIVQITECDPEPGEQQPS